MVQQQGASLVHRPILYARRWDGPPVTCATCARDVTPELRAGAGRKWWGVPRHAFAPGPSAVDCGGSYRLIGPAPAVAP